MSASEQERPASFTAVGVAVLRAVHQIYDGDPKILNDPIISRLLERAALQKAKENLAIAHRQ